MIVIREAEIRKIAEIRDQHEVELAKALLTQFRASLYPIRMLCRDLIGKLLDRSTPAVENTIVKNGQLRVFHSGFCATPTRASVRSALSDLLQNSFRWSPEGCSDIIRLYGEVVENAPGFESQALHKEVMRGSRLINVRDSSGRVKEAEIVEDVSFAKGFFRDRKPGAGGAPPNYVANTYGAGPTGITSSRLTDKDTVKKIDRMFALPEGASISGTTADSIYSFTLARPNIPCDGWLHLLPIATMVSQYHHTLLECALTLTKNKKITYQIGFYRSLKPLSGYIRPEVQSLLANYEQAAIDKNLVVFTWSNGGDRTGLLLESSDAKIIGQFRDLATINNEHMLTWRYMADKNNAGPAWDLWTKHIKPETLPIAAQNVLHASGLEQTVRARYGIKHGAIPQKHSLLT